jgi:CRISPR-associated protein Cmr4
MYQTHALIGYFAETAIHAGGGDSWGAIDLAIQRDKVTGFPIIAGSSLKGSIRAHVERSGVNNETITVFGPDPEVNKASEHSGAISFTDARTLLFPVRSLRGVYAWVTCPMVLDRFCRDIKGNPADVPTVTEGNALVTGDHLKAGDGFAVLDRYQFKLVKTGGIGADLMKAIEGLIPTMPAYTATKERLKTHLAVISDEDFADIVKHATDIQTRIRIDQKTGTVVDGALFFQENLPGETLMYGTMLSQKPTGSALTSDTEVMLFMKGRLNGQTVQMGGDGSVGKGFVSVTISGGR